MDKRQYNMLKKIGKVKFYDYTRADHEEKEIIFYLARNNYITYASDDNDESKRLCSISQNGKSAIYEQKISIRDKWLPYIITTVISILALMKSYGFGIDDLFISCMKLLRQLLQLP